VRERNPTIPYTTTIERLLFTPNNALLTYVFYDSPNLRPLLMPHTEENPFTPLFFFRRCLSRGEGIPSHHHHPPPLPFSVTCMKEGNV
jgi:hypothetical protein